jgi:hypothetical protein
MNFNKYDLSIFDYNNVVIGEIKNFNLDPNYYININIIIESITKPNFYIDFVLKQINKQSLDYYLRIKPTNFIKNSNNNYSLNIENLNNTSINNNYINNLSKLNLQSVNFNVKIVPVIMPDLTDKNYKPLLINNINLILSQIKINKQATITNKKRLTSAIFGDTQSTTTTTTTTTTSPITTTTTIKGCDDLNQTILIKETFENTIFYPLFVFNALLFLIFGMSLGSDKNTQEIPYINLYYDYDENRYIKQMAARTEELREKEKIYKLKAERANKELEKLQRELNITDLSKNNELRAKIKNRLAQLEYNIKNNRSSSEDIKDQIKKLEKEKQKIELLIKDKFK